jgi:hypothetical protein
LVSANLGAANVAARPPRRDLELIVCWNLLVVVAAVAVAENGNAAAPPSLPSLAWGWIAADAVKKTATTVPVVVKDWW